MKTKIFSTIILTLVALSMVSAIGITSPRPQNIELVPGESSYFTMEVQSDDFSLICIPLVQETDDLELAFNQQYEVEPNQRYTIKPQVIAPKKTSLGLHTAKFCLECSPSKEVSGSKIIPRVCGLPVTVNTVADRTRPNMFDKQENYFFIWITLLIIAILVLAVIIYYLIRRRRRVAA